MYTVVLGREAEEGVLNNWTNWLLAHEVDGKSMWVNLLNNGMTRTEVLEGFSRSTEFTNILKSFGL